MKDLKDLSATPEFGHEDFFLDQVVGLGEITEICGPCGTGKTQIW